MIMLEELLDNLFLKKLCVDEMGIDWCDTCEFNDTDSCYQIIKDLMENLKRGLYN